MEHNSVHIEARNACTEAERVFTEVVDNLVNYKVDVTQMVGRGHCFCSSADLSAGGMHRVCCKCGDRHMIEKDGDA